ncbi:hypothetical protein CHS0354_021470 [Potamilus streckersoni]|uniref:Uncharacterized protein n=1 Tax=Potamilus streckersoni TaxID=2493646 RepID=A0AAE0S1L6_9BIVA|nr:hypothetical protein CHS0354_021470 [Potamilus streckersoni]
MGTKNNIEKPATEIIKNNPIVDEFLKTSIAEQVEHLYKKSTQMRRALRVIIDKLHQGRAIVTEVFRSDKLSPKGKLAKIRRFLTLLNLPDIVPDDLLATTIPISGSDLGLYIEDMINDPDLLQHYNDLLSNWSSIIPESRIKREPKLTVSNVIEKIKIIYRSFGASLITRYAQDFMALTIFQL